MYITKRLFTKILVKTYVYLHEYYNFMFTKLTYKLNNVYFFLNFLALLFLETFHSSGFRMVGQIVLTEQTVFASGCSSTGFLAMHKDAICSDSLAASIIAAII